MAKSTLARIFKKERNIVIGALHFPPLLGFPEFPGYKETLAMAKRDLKAFVEGGVDGIILENNYGLSPEKISTANAIAMGRLIGELRNMTTLPLGASVLWNDYETALSLAVTYDLQFIRIPVFVDIVQTYAGVIKGNPRQVAEAKQRLGAEQVALFTDVLVKHSKHISQYSLPTAARRAATAGSDAVIVTGDWTGHSPEPATLKDLRSRLGDFPIIVGSGANVANASELCQYANGAIVSTALKAGTEKARERNVKEYTQRVSRAKVRSFTRSLR